MKVNIARSAGFCFGVKRALAIALGIAGKKGKVYMLGDIVHNEDVVREIKKSGIKKIGRLGKGGGKILLISAHGAPVKIFRSAAAAGFKVMDATCPMVKKIHKTALDMENRGRRIIIIGDKKHSEVIGILGHLKDRAIVIDNPDNIPAGRIKGVNKAAVVVQSTQNIEKAIKILKRVKKYVPDLVFCNTICRPTTIKQEEIKKMPLENDVMVIIGSKNSANTRRLYEISKSLNKRSYWIRSSGDLKRGWFKGAGSVGVAAGASTPESTINDVAAALR
ncbi:MAG: 4-hydroxy-3-methylbut-2-enyl diphosphate reductase [Candidatus Omnitrophica bacterium]|nr:4-hydroxy-3-methylbut-2-enyl diphosphate reductase [Candidatus Omnitrophota bacterium]